MAIYFVMTMKCHLLIRKRREDLKQVKVISQHGIIPILHLLQL